MKSGKGVVWITGGAKGIGFATARKLGNAGYSIAISGRDKEALAVATRQLQAESITAASFVCDSSNSEQVEATYSEIQRTIGEVEILINNAGTTSFETFSETSVERFDEVISTNVVGNFLCVKAVLPQMYAAKRGTIVQMLSIASTKAFKGGAAYGASKFAIHGFTNALREEARQYGVRVISILPGATETEAWGKEEREKFHDRMMQPEDIASLIHTAIELPHRALIEEIVVRPIGGDL